MSEEEKPRIDFSEYRDVRTYLSWTAPGRPYRKKGRQFYVTVLLLLMLCEIIFFLFSMYILMVVGIALAFLYLVLNTIPPKDFHYRVSSEGIKIEDHFYIWNELYDFYFKKIDGVETLIVRTQALLPGELKITLHPISRDHMRRVLVQYLPYREVVQQTLVEKWGDWLAQNFPLEGV